MKPELRFKLLVVGGLGLLFLVADQLTKLWVIKSMNVGDPITIIKGVFDFERHPGNPGAAFGLFSDLPEGVRVPFFVVAAILALGVVVYFAYKTSVAEKWTLVGLGTILGGALGNLIDRVARDGLVVDFIHTRWDGVFDYPIYNVADIGITVGVALLLVDSFILQPRAKKKRAEQKKNKKKNKNKNQNKKK